MAPQDRAAVLSPINDSSVQQALGKILEPLAPEESEAERMGSLLNAFREQAEIRNLVAEASVKVEDALPPKDLESALKRLRFDSLVKREGELNEQIRAAEQAGDSQAGDALLMELMELRRQRAQI